MKKTIALALTLALAISMTACGGAASSAAPAASTPASSAPAASSAASSEAAVSGLTAPIAESPILLTGVGQSADVEMVKVMLEKAELEYTMDNATDGADLGDAKTLVLAVGGSSKGLGAAGIDADDEIARVESLIAAAKDAGMTVIALHIGGEARRGELSDKFLAPSFDNADYAIVVKDGDKDGAIAAMAAAAGIPLDYADSMGTVVTPLKAAFK